MNKTLAELSSEELSERRRYHINVIKLIDSELEKRGSIVKTEAKTIIKKTGNNVVKTTKKPITEGTKTKKQYTRNDMMAVLDKKDIKYKKIATKAELLEIVRKNNLVRTVEEYSQQKKE